MFFKHFGCHSLPLQSVGAHRRYVMQAKFIGFGELEIDGRMYDYDVVIDKGKIRKRNKKASKAFRAQYNHTPLSAEEDIPWGGKTLIIGTGAYGSLPVMPKVLKEAEDRGIKVITVPTDKACKLVSAGKDKKIRAILHVTC